MRVTDDTVAALGDRATERMHFRAKPHIKATIQRAAALSGMDDSTFTMNAAYTLALETIAAHERTHLMPEDLEAFFGALDTPPAPTPALQDAFERHGRRIRSR